MSKTYGKFEKEPEQEEYMALSFAPNSIPMKWRWKNNSLSADFLGDYLSNFFPEMETMTGKYDQKEIRSAVSFIANELLENAVKFSVPESHAPITLALYLRPQYLRFFIKNFISEDELKILLKYIDVLLNSDPAELYVQQVKENSVKSLHEGSSRLGLVSMLNDYNGILGWRVEQNPDYPGQAEVTTMVRLNI